MALYMTLPDKTEIYYEPIPKDDAAGILRVQVRKDGKTARCEMPKFVWTEREGFDDRYLEYIEGLLFSNAFLLYREAREAGSPRQTYF